MSLQLKGYVLEGVRVGGANSPFTVTPDNCKDSSFDTVFPASEPRPQVDYLVLSLASGLLGYDASFAWTKNETVTRFGYDGRNRAFSLFPGKAREALGKPSNTTRLKAPLLSSDIATYPVRVAVAEPLETAFTVAVVPTDADFTSPAAGSVQISFASGNINWHSGDLTTYIDSTVYFQGQSLDSKNTGSLGDVGLNIYLNPLPAPGQHPILRLGYGVTFAATEVANDASFSSNPATAEWSRTTGRLKFHSTSSGPVFYVGLALGYGLSVESRAQGTVASPSPLSPLPDEAADSFLDYGTGNFSLTFVDSFGSPSQGTVQVRRSDGALLFNAQDVVDHGASAITLKVCDLALESGVKLRLQRTLAPGESDVSAVYHQADALIADPIIQSPSVPLPARPLTDGYALSYEAIQGTGSYVGPLPRLDVTGAPTGFGVTVDFASQSVIFAEKVANRVVTPAGSHVVLDPLLSESNLVLEEETSPGVYTASTEYSVDLPSGVVSLTRTLGSSVYSGTATVAGSVLTDSSATFSLSGLKSYLLDILTGPNPGVYRVVSSTGTTLTAHAALGSGSVTYRVLEGYETIADNYFTAFVAVDPHTKLYRDGSPLVLGKDYKLQPQLGFVDLSERLLANQELLFDYRLSDDTAVSERCALSVRKETATTGSYPATVFDFNPLSREVAPSPAPRIYRGGRPQSSAEAITVGNTVKFVGGPTVTDALPSGAVTATETVLIDYYVYGAIGGEKSFSTLQRPLKVVTYSLIAGETGFALQGDFTSAFFTGAVIRLASGNLYTVSTSSLASGITTVNLTSALQEDATNPALDTSSAAPSYVPAGSYSPVSRGSNTVKLSSTDLLKAGTLLRFGTDVYYVQAAEPNDAGQTLTLSAPTRQEYSGVTAYRSFLPIFETPKVSSFLARAPVGEVKLIRIPKSAAGQFLATTDYTSDPTGRVAVYQELATSEALVAIYTGYRTSTARVRASYVHTITPDAAKGLQGQILRSSYYTYLPDTFYFRVVPITDFRAELALQLEKEVKATMPSSGPILENSSSPKLFEQGSPSLYFPERRLANEDIAARSYLLFLNDSVNSLEQTIRSMTGRVVGDSDGLFLFDASQGTVRTAFEDVENQIDDVFKTSPAPYIVTGPPFTLTSLGTFSPVYKAAALSRFFPTRRTAVSVIGPGTDNNDVVGDLGRRPILGLSSPTTRLPWAVTTAVSSTATYSVDTTAGSNSYVRPALANGMKVSVTDQQGNVIYSDAAPATIATVAPTQVTFSGVPTAIPVGSTIRLSTTDPAYKTYVVGSDVGVSTNDGLLLRINPFPPIPPFSNTPPTAGEVLDTLLDVPATNTAPERFPALDGITTTDDGWIGFPVQNPSASSETGGSLNYGSIYREKAALTKALLETTPSLAVTGTLNPARTVITATLSPVPSQGDLVLVTTGTNAYAVRYVASATGSSLTLASALTASEPSSFNFLISSGTLIRAGVGSGQTTWTDLTADFTLVKPGHTLIIPGSYLRRTVLKVNSTTQLTIDPLPATLTSVVYRVEDSLMSYGGPTITEASGAFTAENSHLSTELDNMAAFFLAAMEASVLSAVTVTAPSTVTGAVLTPAVVGDYLLLLGKMAKITAKPSPTVATVDLTLAGGATTTYLLKRQGIDPSPVVAIYNATATYAAGLYTTYSEPTDSGAVARPWLAADLSARVTALTSRIATVATQSQALDQYLRSTEKLYDRRYSWIDTRINLLKGLLVKQERAVTARKQALVEARVNMQKLAAL